MRFVARRTLTPALSRRERVNNPKRQYFPNPQPENRRDACQRECSAQSRSPKAGIAPLSEARAVGAQQQITTHPKPQTLHATTK